MRRPCISPALITLKMENIRDLSKFGYRELEIAGDLLKAYTNIGRKMQTENFEMSDNVAVEFNPSSGNVFLVDEDCNVGMINDDGKLENWLSCSNCGYEGYKSDEAFDGYAGDTCNECADNK